MAETIKIAGICGSLRKESYNRKILNYIKNNLPSGVEIIELFFDDFPLYNEDIDTPAASERPVAVRKFRDNLAACDGIVIVSPEYNYSIPGGLKNAIDWISRGNDSPLWRKPVSLIGATTGKWGTVRMQIAFQNIYNVMNMRPVLKPEILIMNAQEKFDSQGNFTDHNAMHSILKNMKHLKELILREK